MIALLKEERKHRIGLFLFFFSSSSSSSSLLLHRRRSIDWNRIGKRKTESKEKQSSLNQSTFSFHFLQSLFSFCFFLFLLRFFTHTHIYIQNTSTSIITNKIHNYLLRRRLTNQHLNDFIADTSTSTSVFSSYCHGIRCTTSILCCDRELL